MRGLGDGPWTKLARWVRFLRGTPPRRRRLLGWQAAHPAAQVKPQFDVRSRIYLACLESRGDVAAAARDPEGP